MKLAISSGRSPTALKREWTSAEAAELYAAERCGLLPDWWLMVGKLCCVVANCHGGDTKPSDFVPQEILYGRTGNGRQAT
jgi:hypothetical protein